MSLSQRQQVSRRQHFQALPASRAGLGHLGWLLCCSFVLHEPLLALFVGSGVGIVDTLNGSTPELTPQEAEQLLQSSWFLLRYFHLMQINFLTAQKYHERLREKSLI